MTNKELAHLVNQTILESGYKKSFIAEKLGISRQAFSHLLDKRSFSIEDASRILEIVGYDLEIVIHKNID